MIFAFKIERHSHTTKNKQQIEIGIIKNDYEQMCALETINSMKLRFRSSWNAIHHLNQTTQTQEGVIEVERESTLGIWGNSVDIKRVEGLREKKTLQYFFWWNTIPPGFIQKEFLRNKLGLSNYRIVWPVHGPFFFHGFGLCPMFTFF